MPSASAPTSWRSPPTSTPVYAGRGTANQRAVAQTTPAWSRARSFAAGSMAPKVEAGCRFVEATGKRATIGQLKDLPRLIDGTTGTQIQPDRYELDSPG